MSKSDPESAIFMEDTVEDESVRQNVHPKDAIIHGV